MFFRHLKLSAFHWLPSFASVFVNGMAILSSEKFKSSFSSLHVSLPTPVLVSYRFYLLKYFLLHPNTTAVSWSQAFEFIRIINTIGYKLSSLEILVAWNNKGWLFWTYPDLITGCSISREALISVAVQDLFCFHLVTLPSQHLPPWSLMKEKRKKEDRLALYCLKQEVTLIRSGSTSGRPLAKTKLWERQKNIKTHGIFGEHPVSAALSSFLT